METKEMPSSKIEKRTVQLVKGLFTPSEASDAIIALIDEKINFHTIQRLKIWEGNHHSETNLLDSRIDELREERQTARNIIEMARKEGKNIQIDGVLKMVVQD